MATTITIAHTIECFLLGHLKVLVYGEAVTTQTDFVACLHAACILVNTALLLRRMHSSVPMRAPAYFDILGGLEYLPL
ncbi:hypothetical protein TNCV_2069651 [Trichonephila clavipes]|uniref:Uncharacterized protein n=1 Tax=Trichonephila clavipes TaxID=2585209 RepID=A0A8X7BD74_TRICX|nr:hypothetical protein TNCV_2069651 [Trichonephila clavipes]